MKPILTSGSKGVTEFGSLEFGGEMKWGKVGKELPCIDDPSL